MNFDNALSVVIKRDGVLLDRALNQGKADNMGNTKTTVCSKLPQDVC
jgi:hypothetical protein